MLKLFQNIVNLIDKLSDADDIIPDNKFSEAKERYDKSSARVKKNLQKADYEFKNTRRRETQ